MQTPYFFVKVNRSEKTMELHLVFVDGDHYVKTVDIQ